MVFFLIIFPPCFVSLSSFPLSFLLRAQGKHSKSIYGARIIGTLVFEVLKAHFLFSHYIVSLRVFSF